MSEKLGAIYTKSEEELVRVMRIEFLDEAIDNLHALDVSLDAARNRNNDVDKFVNEVRRLTLPLRGQAPNYGARLMGTVAHRLENYVGNVKTLPPRFFDDIQRFIDTLLDLAEGRISFDADPSEVVRTLPAKFGFDLGDIEVQNVEVILVMLHGAATHFVEREMHQCGYRISIVTSIFDAIPLIVRTKPNLVITSAIMPELEGIDLVIALVSMPSTRNIPSALITSLDPEDEYLKLVPESVPIIFKGPSFGEDLAEALSRLFLI